MKSTFVSLPGITLDARLLSITYNLHESYIKLGGGGVQGQGKGQRLMTTFGWQHAKVESTKSNPPSPLGSKMLSC